VNFNYFISEAVFDYVVRAVHLVAEQGWRLLPDYAFDPQEGLWAHRDGPVEAPLSLRDVTFTDDGVDYPAHRRATEPDSELPRYLEEGRLILEAAPSGRPGEPTLVDDDFEHLRWFPLPTEISVG
jgi:hypothetical protein